MTSRSLDLLAGAAPDAPALLEKARVVTRGQARTMTEETARFLGDDRKKLVMVENPRSLPGALACLAALRAGHAVLPVEALTPDDARTYIDRLRPDVLVGPTCTAAADTPAGYGRPETAPHIGTVRRAPGSQTTSLAEELALVLRTSGSTSHGRLVRLSYDNLASNAASIGTATSIRPTDVAATSLRMDHSFGLSLFTSHLAAGAAVGLLTATPSSDRFWAEARILGATCAGLVPSTARFILRSHESAAKLATLRSLLVAGGPASPDELRRLREHARSVYYMYGQTEATARMTCLDPAAAADHEGSVGTPVPGGHIEIRGHDGTPLPEGRLGEVYYRGPNVMLGYAGSRADLALPDVTGDTLRTGDLGRARGGMLYLEGRIDRQVKVLGQRVNLDAVEATATATLGGTATAAVHTAPDEVSLYVEGDPEHMECLRAADLAYLGVPRGSLRLRTTPRLPRTPSGKIRYAAVGRHGTA
ncbi:AMP-binding protein [Streptomyces sp. NBC_01268]|uniref:AMP-binding protein n=1 Tax=Streptomyces sp. NBC_01268 TaxID=2903806 RepID=UPI002E322602|nr:AMP-binding protein [Streptomyces sp. NBC_01268]